MTMIVKTVNPLIVAGKKISNESKYLNLDGGSSKAEIKAFQDWMDANYPTWLNGVALNKGAGYGNFGKNTKSAWVSYGSIYDNRKKLGGVMETESRPTGTKMTAQEKLDKAKGVAESGKGLLETGKGIFDTIGGIFGKGKGATTGEPEVLSGGVYGQDNQKQGISKGMKIGLVVGGALLIGTVIYFATKKK